jgi:hypothetical protein
LTAYPPSDDDVREYLQASSQQTDSVLKLRFLAFLISMFECAKPEIERFKGTYCSVAKQWHEFLAFGQKLESVGPNRKEFYHKVVLQAELVLHFAS